MPESCESAVLQIYVDAESVHTRVLEYFCREVAIPPPVKQLPPGKDLKASRLPSLTVGDLVLRHRYHFTTKMPPLTAVALLLEHLVLLALSRVQPQLHLAGSGELASGWPAMLLGPEFSQLGLLTLWIS